MTNGPTEQQIEEAYEGVVPTKPPEANNNRCHNCDMPFVPEQWDERHINPPGSIAESWIYKCPSCDEETVEVGI